MAAFRDSRAQRIHSYAYLWEPLEKEPSFVVRPMFGTRAVYLHGRIVLCFSERPTPWNGVLVATEQSHQASLIQELPALVPHSVLPKWLFLSADAPGFDRTAERLIRLVSTRDPRIGVVPKRKPRARQPRSGGAGVNPSEKPTPLRRRRK
jgi:hypothetical protein